MDEGKIFLTVSDVAEDLQTDQEDAERIVKELNERIANMGGLFIRGQVSASFYHRMKATGFTSAEGKSDRESLTEKRLLNIKEFCTYSGLGKTKARSYAEEKGLIVRIGRRILVDRLKFDRLCDDLKA